MNILRTVIRPLIAAPFISDGIDAVRHPQQHAEKAKSSAPLMRRVGLSVIADNPVLATKISGVVTIAAASCLAIGKAPRLSAAVLTALSLPTAFIQIKAEHKASDKVSTAVTRGALTGAMVLAALDREGQPSTVWRASNWISQQKDLASLRWDSMKNSAEAELESARANVASLLG